jgi:hypothetical protein
VKDGVLWLNCISFVVFVNSLPGPLAKALHLRSSFFDAFADIGSQSAKHFLHAKLERAAGDQAAQLIFEPDGLGQQSGPAAGELLQSPEARQTEELSASDDLELERQAKRARLLREIAADEEATATSKKATAILNETATRAREIVSADVAARSADVAARGISIFSQIQTLEGLDDRERIALRARVTTSLLGVEQAQPIRCEVILENFLREQRSNVNPSVLGRKAAAIWNALHVGEIHPKKRIVLANGQATDVNIYYEDEIETVLLPALQQCASSSSARAPPVNGDLKRLLGSD